MATITTTTPPENLTGWTVTVPDGWSASSGYGLFSIDFDLPDAYDNTSLGIGYYFDFDDPSTLKPATNLVTAYSSIMTWSPNASFTFTVTGGLDVSNSSLIQWLADNKATFSKEEEGTQVDKTNNLPAFLKDLYEGIITKKPDASKNPQNFRGEIEAIVTGITPTGSLTITANGTYPVTEKAEVIVAVPETPEWDGSFTILISFTIGSKTYYSPEGWTWEQWVADTNYNTAGLTLLQSGTVKVVYNGAGYYVVIGTTGVHSDEEIIPNQKYLLYSGSSYLD